MSDVKVVVGSDRNFFAKLIVKFPSGTMIFEEGDLGTTMYIIQKGQVEIRKSIGGAEQILSVLEKGDFFGEMSILEGATRSASAYAIDDVELLEIDEAVFDQMLRTNQEIAIRMLRKLSRKLRQTTELLEQLAGRTISTEIPKPDKPTTTTGGTYKVVFTEDESIETQINPEGETLFGRKDPVTGIFPDVDLGRMDSHRSVSRRHAVIIVDGGTMYLKEELGTMNGTFVNGQKLEKGKPVAIKEGDILQFGAVQMRVDVV